VQLGASASPARHEPRATKSQLRVSHDEAAALRQSTGDMARGGRRQATSNQALQRSRLGHSRIHLGHSRSSTALFRISARALLRENAGRGSGGGARR